MRNTDDLFNLGDRVRDSVTGFEGIVTGITVFLNGCRRMQVLPPVAPDGGFRDERWFDEPQLVMVQPDAYERPLHKPQAAFMAATGGDRPDCPPRSGGAL